MDLNQKVKPHPWSDAPWFYATSEGNLVLEVERALQMTFYERLVWNENALEVASLFHGKARPPEHPPPSSASLPPSEF